MESYFKLEDYAKSMLLASKKEEDIERWQHILELNRSNANYLYVN